jgi:signal transduction histidine kinase
MGSVRGDVSRGPLTLCISVADDGPGLPPAVVERLETLAEAGSVERVVESGFGLSVVKHLVTSVGGRIRVERPTEGGTKIIVALPIVPAASIRRAA